MNTPSNVMQDSPLGSREIAPVGLSVTRPMYWSVRRELWENRSIYLAPLGAAGVYLLGFLIMISLGRLLHHAILMPYEFVAGLLMVTQILVGVFYSLDALHGERRDRSILFWKSLPVSDVTTVVSKASIPIVVVPLLTFAITFVTQFIMLLLSSAVIAGKGMSVATLLDAGGLLSDVARPPLSPRDGARAEPCAILWLAVAGFCLGAAGGVSVGVPAIAGHRLPGEDRFQHLVFRRHAGTSIVGRLGGCHLPGHDAD